MTKLFKNLPILLFVILIISSALVLLYQKFVGRSFLTFSDGAKFAIVAKNFIDGNGFTADFTFYSKNVLTRTSNFFSSGGVPILIPVVMGGLFKVFGASDFSVLLFSEIFYVLLVATTFLLARKIFGNHVGFLSAILVAFSQSLLNYATSGASELLYMFLGLISTYLIYLNNKGADVIFFISLVLIYLSRPQGIVFIGALLFLWFLQRFDWKKGLVYFAGLLVVIFFVDKLILYPLSFRYPVYPIFTRGLQAILQYSPSSAISDGLRGQVVGQIGLTEIVKKAFYNLYNFYKLMPDIMSPYLISFFVVGLFIQYKNKNKNLFTLLTLLIFVGTFGLAALTIPFYRYLHPVIPFVYILASATLIWIVERINDKPKNVKFISIFLILFFVVGQTLGSIFLDSRFERNTHNVSQPPVYVKLSYLLRDNSSNDWVIVTNLDTWGSWYGQRKTVWFPLEPMQIIDPKTGTIPFDAIYLTSYLIDDQNYYMGSGWRTIFENPENPEKWTCDGCKEISSDFRLKGVYKIPSDQDYEKIDATAVLLTKI